MEVLEFIIGFFIALIIGAVFFYGFRRRGPWNAFWVFLLFLVLAAWAGRLWLVPAGPVFWGYGWLSVVFWVFIFGLLIALATPSETTDETINYEAETRTGATPETTGAASAFGILFWILLVILIVAIVGGFWY